MTTSSQSIYEESGIMKTWEYKVTTYLPPIQPNEIEESLNALGADGWELISVIQLGYSFTNPYMYTFRRSLPLTMIIASEPVFDATQLNVVAKEMKRRNRNWSAASKPVHPEFGEIDPSAQK
jgi:hypothetical protein